MKPVKTENTNSILRAPEGSDNVIDLPITRLKYNDGQNAVESCWELSEEELKKVLETKKIYFVCMGVTHPPILVSAESQIES
ncbi:hypothetical protein C1H57_12505 [Clostridium sp. 2-1]|uniref:hypothetical protein n=1 Tax=Clostridium TaxID=1485 RepID=UPI000CDB0903|nr:MULTISPECIES: hypothetical protein [Clostridium]MBN7576012.1 hypothetical protein [Clostridium beijerinckii]MBN7581155.1 hypothetical protein [Clostridium beijerinckii]MBN7585733.1 hypothetical protein [Clostridium beijerinckii]MBO0521522.1 hypothetical protein [Clostridium beijerinckii]POO91003.1 hypothetical protein C1H57_12505 [Clostridium sp. 2-1]